MKPVLRWSVPFLAAVAFVAVNIVRGHAEPPRPAAPIEVLFAPTGRDRLIEKAIAAELDRARRTVDIAIYQFTAPELSKKVEEIRKHAKVRILFDAEQADHGSRREAPSKILPGISGIEAKFVDLGGGGGADAPKFHHKFCVIDGETVITGSYNWSVLGDESNHENLLIIRDAATAQKYAAQFEKVWNDTTIAKPPEKKPVENK